MILEILKFILKLIVGLIVMINVWVYILFQKLVKRISRTNPKKAKTMEAVFHYITLPLAPFSKMFDTMH